MNTLHYALNPRTFLFSHYFYTGIRIAVGVIGLTLLVLLNTNLTTAMTVCIGALCTSLMDLPSPLRHKFNEMLASVLLCTAVTLIISLCAPIHWLLGPMLVAVTFTASMMVVYGKKTMPLQFAALFIMTLSMENHLHLHQVLFHSALFMVGGLSYLAYAMTVAWLLQRRTRQQVLAEALFALARYIGIKAEFYDMHVDLNAQFNLLVREQIVLADRQQASRDMILRDRQHDRDAIMVQVHYGMLDLYELILSTHTDYALLRRHFADAEVLSLLRDLIRKTARDIESIALAVTRKHGSFAGINYHHELHAVETALQRLAQQQPDSSVPDEALTVLRASYNKARAIIGMIDQLHRATQKQLGPLPAFQNGDMTPFLTQQKYELGLLLSNLRWQSPIFRFALRVAMAVAVGLLVAEHLPYAAHGYWIVLTIVIILKPSFSMTKQRRGDRLIGTLIGCGLTALILQFVHEPIALLGFLFLATAAAPAFIYVKYRYTAVAASMQILLQINLLIPSGVNVIGERLIDTVIGAAIATAFSFILPSWEYRALPRLIRNVLEANRRYITASRDLLQGKVVDDFVYRLCRKQFMDSLAGLSSALVRMLDEPASKQRAVEDINHFIVLNYLVAAHVAALRMLVRDYPEGLPRESFNTAVQQAYDRMEHTLGSVENAPTAEASDANAPDQDKQAGLAAPQSIVTDHAESWSGWRLLQRRIKLLLADADAISARAAAIGRLLQRST